MLILDLRVGEIVDITNESGQRVEVKRLHNARNGDMRLGFSAPRSIVIDRRNVTERKERERAKGANGNVEERA